MKGKVLKSCMVEVKVELPKNWSPRTCTYHALTICENKNEVEEACRKAMEIVADSIIDNNSSRGLTRENISIRALVAVSSVDFLFNVKKPEL